MNWKSFLQNKRYRTEFIITIIILIPLLLSFSQFLLFVEQRAGVILNDPLLNSFNPIDLTWLIFVLIYLSLIIFIITTYNKPKILLLALQSYGLMVIFRAITMYLTPFEPPALLLLLNDPFVQLFGEGDILTKDLFFSGHTGTLFLLFLLTENKTLRSVFLFATIIVGTAVLLQHVHYTVDVFVAPFISYASYKIITNLHIKLSHEIKK